MNHTGHRKTLWIILASLAIIPVALLVQHLIFERELYNEDSIETMLFIILGIPILVFNFWAWSYPEIIEFFLWGDSGDR